MKSPPGGVDAADVLRFLADEEPLKATQARFPEVPEGVLRELLRRVAASIVGQRVGLPPPERQAASQVLTGPAVTTAGTSKPTALPRVVVYSDGASKGNPGPSGAGWVICEPDGRLLAKGGIFIGRRTNNEAEYIAAAMGLKAAQQFGANAVLLRADSELMVKQLNGMYRVKHPNIIPLFDQVRAIAKEYRSFSAEHVPRAQNAAADEQANLAISEARNR